MNEKHTSEDSGFDDFDKSLITVIALITTVYIADAAVCIFSSCS